MKIRADSEQYRITDLALPDGVVSVTQLRTETNGHGHGYEELYYFVSGKGKMKINEREFPVGAGDFVSVGLDEFHKVWNEGNSIELVFVVYFKGRPKEGTE